MNTIIVSLGIINSHCKDLTALMSYLWEYKKSEVASGEKRLTNSEYRLEFLDAVSMMYYNVHLYAKHNGTLKKDVTDPMADFPIWNEKTGKFEVKPLEQSGFVSFIFPEREPLEFYEEVKKDRDYLYKLKNAVADYIIWHGEADEQVNVSAVTHIGKKIYVILDIGEKSFHHKVSQDEFNKIKEKYPDIQEVEHNQRTYRYKGMVDKEDVIEAVRAIKKYLESKSLF